MTAASLSVDPQEVAGFLPSFTFDEVRALLATDPLGAAWLMGNEGMNARDESEARWFLFELFRSRPVWFAQARAGKSVAGRQQVLL